MSTRLSYQFDEHCPYHEGACQVLSVEVYEEGNKLLMRERHNRINPDVMKALNEIFPKKEGA